MKRKAIMAAAVLSIALPALAGIFGAEAAYAQAPTPSGAASSANPADSGAANHPFQLVTCTPTFDPTNPGVLKNDCNYHELVATAERVFQFVMYIIIPIMVAMLMFTGFKYMMAGGDANLVADAKRMLKPVLLGLFFMLAAWLIVHTILDKLLATTIGDVSKTSIIGTTSGN